MRRALLLAVALAATAPATASAATVTHEADGTLLFTVAPGTVANHVNVQTFDQPSATVNFNSGGAETITAWPDDCTHSSAYGDENVSCPVPAAVRVELGDGDDLSQVSSGVVVPVTLVGGAGNDTLEDNEQAHTLDGGPGEDRLTGSGGNDTLRGGDGNDTIDGGDGADSIDAGAGDDLLAPDGHEHANADVVDGGPGVDRIEGDYTSRFSSTVSPVTISLAGGADDGRPDEHDDLRNIEGIKLNVGGTFVGTDGADAFHISRVNTPSTMSGGGGNDVLRTGDGPDRIDGGAGDDSIDGGFGDDVLTGGPGRDTISGDTVGGDCGPLWCTYPYGNDTIEARDGEVDSITCGAGADTVRADVRDAVAPDCETVVRASGGGPGPNPAGPKLVLVGHPRLGNALRRGFAVRVTGLKAGQKLTLTAKRGGRIVARGTASAPVRVTAVTVTLRFTVSGRRRLKRTRSASLVLSGGARGTVMLRR